MYSFPNLELVRCSMCGSNCCFLTCIQVSQEAGKVVWYSHLLKNFPQFIMIYTVKGFGVINKAEVDVFLELPCFFDDPVSQFSCSVLSDSLRPHELQDARPPCPSSTPRVHSNSCPLSQWCHPAISYSIMPFSSCPHPLPASESFPMSQLFAWGGQSIGVSALTSVLPKNTQDWSPLG